MARNPETGIWYALGTIIIAVVCVAVGGYVGGRGAERERLEAGIVSDSSPEKAEKTRQIGFQRVLEAPEKNIFHSELVRVVDGDTYDLRIKAWEDIVLLKRIRLEGVDTPELRPRKGTDEEKAAEKIRARAATDFVRERLTTADGLFFLYSGKSDNFGRVLGSVLYVTGDGRLDIREVLLQEGHATPWTGN